MRALQTAATGMMAQELNVQVISNNIANVRTTGYKRQRVQFQDLLYENCRRAGSATSDQGTQRAGRDLHRLGRQDRLDRPHHERRAICPRRRSSTTSRSAARASSASACPTAAPPTPATARSISTRRASSSPATATRSSPASRSRRTPTSVSIDAQGTVEVMLPGQTAPQQLGQIQLVRFINKVGLESIGDNLFIETAASGRPIDGSAARRASATCSRATSRKATSGGDRDVLADRRAARLRNELQGHHRRRPDDVGDDARCSAADRR